MPAAPETIVARGIADMAADAYELSQDVALAERALLDAYRGERDEPQALAGALALLNSAREGIAALIGEIEGYR